MFVQIALELSAVVMGRGCSSLSRTTTSHLKQGCGWREERRENALLHVIFVVHEWRESLLSDFFVALTCKRQ